MSKVQTNCADFFDEFTASDKQCKAKVKQFKSEVNDIPYLVMKWKYDDVKNALYKGEETLTKVEEFCNKDKSGSLTPGKNSNEVEVEVTPIANPENASSTDGEKPGNSGEVKVDLEPIEGPMEGDDTVTLEPIQDPEEGETGEKVKVELVPINGPMAEDNRVVFEPIENPNKGKSGSGNGSGNGSEEVKVDLEPIEGAMEGDDTVTFEPIEDPEEEGNGATGEKVRVELVPINEPLAEDNRVVFEPIANPTKGTENSAQPPEVLKEEPTPSEMQIGTVPKGGIKVNFEQIGDPFKTNSDEYVILEPIKQPAGVPEETREEPTPSEMQIGEVPKGGIKVNFEEMSDPFQDHGEKGPPKKPRGMPESGEDKTIEVRPIPSPTAGEPPASNGKVSVKLTEIPDPTAGYKPSKPPAASPTAPAAPAPSMIHVKPAQEPLPSTKPKFEPVVTNTAKPNSDVGDKHPPVESSSPKDSSQPLALEVIPDVENFENKIEED